MITGNIEIEFTGRLKNHNGLGRRAASILFMLTHRKLLAARLHEGQAAPGMSRRAALLASQRDRHQASAREGNRKLGAFCAAQQPRAGRTARCGGHWCWSRRTDLGCAHAWEADDWDDSGTERRYRCAKCSGARWFHKKHERGDASRGWVIQRRVVTTKARIVH